MDFKEILLETTSQLSKITLEEKKSVPHPNIKLPATDELKKFVRLVKNVIFPGFVDYRPMDEKIRPYYIGVDLENIFQILEKQIARGLQFTFGIKKQEAFLQSGEIAANFIARIPEIKRLIFTDIQAMAHKDPAVANLGEVIFCYPAIQAILNYRIAHELHLLKVPIIPRIITEMAHSDTGIDINPCAQIGEYFCIDHGTGVVIGQTCIIGKNVMLYQGVTLGAKNFTYDEDGSPINLPRHPILEDNVTVYSNASVLGRITIGHDSVIGGNIWLTHSVGPYSKITQGKPNSEIFVDGLGI